MKARRANQLLSERAELSLAKLQKEQATAALRQAQAERAELELQRTRGEVVLKVDVDSEGFQRGCTVKAILRGWVGNLPGRLEGLSASQMVGILDEEVESVLRALAG